jgi:hypothetical protein
MTAMTLYQVEERIRDRHASFQSGMDFGRFYDFAAEALQVLGAAVLATGGTAPELSEPIRRDLGLS